MKICKKCVLDERFPGVRFNEDSICNLCLSAMDSKRRQDLKDKYEKKFEQLIEQEKAKGSYDCLLAYSGGKDSTYTLHLLKKKYVLRILAFSFDNWFQSEMARQNIRTVLKNINVDHWTITPTFETMKKVILASISNNMYSKKALSRASSICTSCISLIRFSGLRIAIEEEIPFFIFGMSPGQAPIATSIVKTNAQMIKSMQDSLSKPLSEKLGNIISPFFLEERHFQDAENFPYSINLLAFVEYNENEIFKTVEQYGWIKPTDTDANSTNCLLNAFANQVHLEQFGISPYAYEVAELVRSGHLEREEGLKRLQQSFNAKQIQQVKMRLGIE